MSRRVTIAVPEPLFERLQPVKHQINISAICQEALKMAISHEELKQQSTTENGLVERLRSEKKDLLNYVRQEGFELGIRSASNLSYKDFQRFERVSPLAASLDEDVLDYLWTFLDTRDYPEQARAQDPELAQVMDVNPQSRILFAQGWLAGVLSVWQMIKDQVETEA